VASDECYNKNTELFLSNNFYFPAGMVVNFSKNCKNCELRLLKEEFTNFYEVKIGKGVSGKHISLVISPK
jgi:hypothetical protein